MPRWPVSHEDGIYQVTDHDGIRYPITMGGNPVRALNPGWQPVGLQTGLPPFHLLELRHENSPAPDAIWYLTEELEFIAHEARHFARQHIEAAITGLSPLLRDIYDQSLCAAQPGIAPSSHSFDGINPIFVQELIGLVVERALNAPELVLADRLEALSTRYAASGITLSVERIRQALGPGETSAPFETLLSPFSGATLHAQERFTTLGEGLRDVARYRDPISQVTLYAGLDGGALPALYIPVMNTVFTNQDRLSGPAVMTGLFTYYASHTDRLVSKPAPPPPTNWWKRAFGLGHP